RSPRPEDRGERERPNGSASLAEGRGGLQPVERLLTEDGPTEEAVPAHRVEAVEAVGDGPDPDLRLDDDALSERLLAGEDGPVDGHLVGAGAGAVGVDAVVLDLRAGRLDEERALVDTELPRPEHAGGGVLVGLAPRTGARLGAKV